MHRAALILVLGVLLAHQTLWAIDCPVARVSYYEPTDRETLTLAGTALPLTPAKIPAVDPDQALALVSVEGGDISYDFITTPTPSVGHQTTTGSVFYLCGLPSMQRFKAINVGATVTLKITYWRGR